MALTTLLFEETFNGEEAIVNLNARTPDPSGGEPGEYIEGDGRYVVNPDGYADAVGADFSIVRYPYLVPAATAFRIGGDVYREGVDAVGGEVDFYAYLEDGPIAGMIFTDLLRFAIQRHDANLVSANLDWVKAAGAPAPPVVSLAFAGSLAHGANSGRRYHAEINEARDRVRIYRSDFGTGDNEELLAEEDIVFPPELIAHLAADRHPGFAMARAGGLTSFRLYGFQVYEVHEVAECKCLLIVFADDGLTALWTVSTDPAHPRPYLVEPESGGEQQIDVAAGAATVTSVGWAIIDPAQIPGDQDGGFLTGLLALFGLANIGGHRMLLARFVPTGTLGYQVLADGPSSQPRLNADYASYSGEIRDTRETERKVRCFDLVGGTGTAIVGATPAGPEEPGSDPGFTWGTEYH